MAAPGLPAVGAAVLASCILAAAASDIGETIGNGLAGLPVCGSSRRPTLVLNHTLQPGEDHGVLHHFWCTGAAGAVDRMWVEYFVDGERVPSISFQPSMMCGVAFPASLPKGKEYAAGGLCGKSAPVGGWWNTFPVPFYRSIVVTVRADPSDGKGCFGGFVNVRGTVGWPLTLPGSGTPLPLGSRLMMQRVDFLLRQPLEYVTVAALPAGQRGFVFQTSWGVEARPVGGPAAGGGYIEGCWNFLRRAAEPLPGLVVGTGVEDYFDSGYYFGADSGQPIGTTFATALSGLTLFERTGDGYERLSAYRFHASDPLVMVDGGRLFWRVGAQGKPGMTKCGNPMPAATGGTGGLASAPAEQSGGPGGLGRALSAVNVTTYSWIYTLPKAHVPSTDAARPQYV